MTTVASPPERTPNAPRRRAAGLRGRKAPRHIDALGYSRLLADSRGVAILPPWAPPPAFSALHGIATWGMDGNDVWPDCVPAATDHYRVAKTGNVQLIGKLGGVGPVAAFQRYQQVKGATPKTTGCVIGTWLLWLYQEGITEGFVQLDHTNPAEVHQGVVDFFGVLLGVELTPNAEEEFSDHQPWTLAGTQPTPTMGHGVLLAAYDPQGETVITWGGRQRTSIAWDSGCVVEAWAIVTSDDATRVGINMALLTAVINGLGGRQDVPVPHPQPQPRPNPQSPVQAPTEVRVVVEQPAIATTAVAESLAPLRIGRPLHAAYDEDEAIATSNPYRATAGTTGPAVSLPTWTTGASVTSFAAAVISVVLGLLTQLHVTVPASVSNNVTLWASVVGYGIAAVFLIVNIARHASVTKTAIAAGVAVSGKAPRGRLVLGSRR